MGSFLLVMGALCGDDLTGSCCSTDNQGRAACQCQPRVIATLKKDQIYAANAGTAISGLALDAPPQPLAAHQHLMQAHRRHQQQSLQALHNLPPAGHLLQMPDHRLHQQQVLQAPQTPHRAAHPHPRQDRQLRLHRGGHEHPQPSHP